MFKIRLIDTIWLSSSDFQQKLTTGTFFEASHGVKSHKKRQEYVRNMKRQLTELNTITNSITHPLLLKRITILKHDLVALLDKMKFSPSFQVNYSDSIFFIF